MKKTGRHFRWPLFLAIQLEMRSSFGHALDGKSQASSTMPRPGTNSQGSCDADVGPRMVKITIGL